MRPSVEAFGEELQSPSGIDALLLAVRGERVDTCGEPATDCPYN